MERENSFILRWNDKKDTTFSPAGDLIFEVYLEKKEPGSCCLIKVSPSMRAAEVAETALTMRNVSSDAEDTWTTFEVIENGELERPLHHSERVLEQVLEWSGLDCPSSAFLVIKRFPEARAGANGKGQTPASRDGCLKFSDGSSKLLSGHRFQDKHVSLSAGRLLLYRDVKAMKAEKTLQLSSVKCYLGLRKKLKPPTSWGFTVSTDKLQWHFCCENREAQVDWVTDIIRMKHGSDLFSKRASIVTAAEASRGRSLTEGNNVSTQQVSGSKRLTERMTSLDDAGRRPSSYVASQPKSNAAAKGLKHMDALKALEFPPRRASLDVGQPPRFSSTSPSRPLATVPTLLPPLGAKGVNRRPVRGAEGGMPANVLTELNSVLSKSGRGAASNQ